LTFTDAGAVAAPPVILRCDNTPEGLMLGHEMEHLNSNDKEKSFIKH
jgi:hypothetical protein